jgi:hypothetical protein
VKGPLIDYPGSNSFFNTILLMRGISGDGYEIRLEADKTGGKERRERTDPAGYKI